MPDTVIDLIRHGEPEGGEMIRGDNIDHPLSELGWRQMREAVAGAEGWDLVVSSPMARCRPFAVEVAGRFTVPLIVEPRLHEIHMGDWEGMRRAEVAAAHPEQYLAFCRNTVANRPPGGERLDALIARVGPVYDRLVAHYPGRRMLIVCHSGVSRAILCHVLGADPSVWGRLRIGYAGVSRIRHGRFGPAVEFITARRVS
jgi:alpha-ribazole phosphatase